MSVHSFYFKVVYTCETMNYDIDLDMSISDFINIVKNRARADFAINLNYTIEIVEAGQSDNVNGRDAELAPALECSDTTIREKYGDNYKYIAFYIRPVMLNILCIEQPALVEQPTLENCQNNNQTDDQISSQNDSNTR